MDNYGTVDNPAWITTVFCALMIVRKNKQKLISLSARMLKLRQEVEPAGLEGRIYVWWKALSSPVLMVSRPVGRVRDDRTP